MSAQKFPYKEILSRKKNTRGIVPDLKLYIRDHGNKNSIKQALQTNGIKKDLEQTHKATATSFLSKYLEKMQSLQQMMLEKLDIYLLSCTKINSKQIKDLNEVSEILKLSEENFQNRDRNKQ